MNKGYSGSVRCERHTTVIGNNLRVGVNATDGHFEFRSKESRKCEDWVLLVTIWVIRERRVVHKLNLAAVSDVRRTDTSFLSIVLRPAVPMMGPK